MKEQIAKHLLEIEAVLLQPDNPFTWVSGIRSPIYCDNRLTLSYPAVREEIEQGLCALIQESYPACEMLMGTATAGIAHAAIVADRLKLPMGYVRASKKQHGRRNQIEGRVTPGQKIVVVEDLISTATSAIEVVDALRDVGCEVLGIASIFSYELKRAMQNLEEADCRNVSLCDYPTLVEVAVAQGAVDPKSIEKLAAWRRDPEGWLCQ